MKLENVTVNALRTGKFSSAANYTKRDTESRAYRAGSHVNPFSVVSIQAQVEAAVPNPNELQFPTSEYPQ